MKLWLNEPISVTPAEYPEVRSIMIDFAKNQNAYGDAYKANYVVQELQRLDRLFGYGNALDNRNTI